MPDSSFTSTPFLPGLPEDLLSSGQFHTDVDVILGTNKEEGLISMIASLLDPVFFQYVKDNWNTLGVAGVFGIADVTEITEDLVAMSYEMLDFYVGGGVENANLDHLQGLLDMYTDSGFLYGVHKTTGYLLAHGVTVYQYLLTHRGEHSFTQLYGLPDTVGHASRYRGIIHFL